MHRYTLALTQPTITSLSGTSQVVWLLADFLQCRELNTCTHTQKHTTVLLMKTCATHTATHNHLHKHYTHWCKLILRTHTHYTHIARPRCSSFHQTGWFYDHPHGSDTGHRLQSEHWRLSSHAWSLRKLHGEAFLCRLGTSGNSRENCNNIEQNHMLKMFHQTLSTS